jgi:hypothetical protein
MSNLGKIAYVALYLPLMLLLLWLIYRKLKSTWPFLVLLSLVLVTLPFWDVYMIARDADRLCREQGGLHVYKTVEAEGVSSYSPAYMLKHGFKYVEYSRFYPDKQIKKYRDTLEKGKVVSVEIAKFTVQFNCRTGDNHKVITKKISRSSEQVFNIKTDEVLSEWFIFNIYPGLFDSIFLRLMGSGPVIWHCGDKSSLGKELDYRDLLKATIKPMKVKGKIQ